MYPRVSHPHIHFPFLNSILGDKFCKAAPMMSSDVIDTVFPNLKNIWHSRYKKLKEKNRTDNIGPLVIWRKKTFPILVYSSLLNQRLSPGSYHLELEVDLSLHYLLHM